eukprot:TRINITY_DN12721_c0_g1_i1.p1 TRINITY_DN12721_c0_g1~~TRINITY_DN12721_c0_g1_i1.p1  ORF type:complete len:127 (+),score=37.26 TRINITY_DN12721_c0_g1_i1:51-431(+)
MDEQEPLTATQAQIDEALAKGYIKVIISEGDDAERPSPGSDCQLHYTGNLVDGTIFDSSRAKGRPFNFELGKGQVIKGWDEGVATMALGERAMLVISPKFGYGKRKVSVIPANSVLIFDVELLDFL